jgi:ribonuclease Z
MSSRYAGDVSDHLAEAREVFDGEMFVPDDGETLDIPYPDE